MGDEYKIQGDHPGGSPAGESVRWSGLLRRGGPRPGPRSGCLFYTYAAADGRSSVNLGGRRILKKKKNIEIGDDTPPAIDIRTVHTYAATSQHIALEDVRTEQSRERK